MNKKILLALCCLALAAVILWLSWFTHTKNNIKQPDVTGTPTSVEVYLPKEKLDTELAKWNIVVNGTSTPQIVSLPLVDDFENDARYGLLSIVCKQAGYDIEEYGGEEILLSTLPTPEIDATGDGVSLGVLHTSTEILCLYKASNGNRAPGISAVGQK